MMEQHTQTRDTLKFTANDISFQAVCKEVDSNMGSAIPQPVLVIGQEGSGKTTLLKRVVSNYPRLPYVWIDGRSIFSTSDIIGQSADISLMIIDNLDFYLERCSYEEQFRLRGFLYNEGAPMMIATVSKLTTSLTEYNAPFFEGLKKIHLSPLSEEEVKYLFAGKSEERAISMFRLTDRSIRTVEIIFNIIESNSDPSNDIKILLSYFSEQFSLSYRNAPINSQHILNILGNANSGLTISEIRNKTNLSSGILSPYLRNLCKQGFVIADKSVKRRTKYYVKNPLFKIWLTSTFHKGGPKAES